MAIPKFVSVAPFYGEVQGGGCSDNVFIIIINGCIGEWLFPNLLNFYHHKIKVLLVVAASAVS